MMVCSASAQAADSCPNAAFRTGAGAKLPDCRAYEQVSPVEKGGVPVSNSYPDITNADGSRSVFASTSSLGGDDSVFLFNPYRASRGSTWATDVMNAPQGDLPQSATGGAVQAVSEDLTHEVVVSRRKLTADATEGAGNVYVREIGPSGGYRFVASVGAGGATSTFSGALQYPSTFVYSGSPDFSRIVFSTIDRLTPDAVDNGNAKVYRWDGGSLRLIGENNGSFPLGMAGPDLHRVTSEGRVTYPASTSAAQLDLFQSAATGARTLITRSHRTGDNPATPQGITGAFFNSPDGTSITFASSRALVNGAVPTAAGTYQSIYRWSEAGDGLVDLLAGKLQTDNEKEAGKQIVGVSDDGDYVYFTSNGLYAPGADPGVYNLYVLHVPDGLLSLVTADNVPETNQIRLSPDGSRFALATAASIGGYDNTGAGCTAPGSPPDPTTRCGEVWTYNAATPDQPLTCVSCPPAGTSPNANATLGPSQSGFNGGLPSAMTDDGRVFFDTGERLATGDGNGTSDVYEYLPGGERRLLSSGGSGGGATLGDISDDGSSVFFVTAAGLVPQDADGVRDVYAARVGGGLAAQQVAPVTTLPCTGAECQGPAPVARPRLVPGSSTLIPYTAPPSTTFKVGKPSSSSLRAFVRSGRLKLRVRVGGPGTVRLRARAKIGSKTKTVATASAKASRSGTVTLTLRLSRAARTELSRKRRLRIAVTAAFSKAAKDSTLRFTITKARAGSSSKGGDR